MTNREWLNNMTDEDFVNWLYADRTRVFNVEKGDYVVLAPNYSPCLHEVTMGWTSGEMILKQWLKEERK